MGWLNSLLVCLHSLLLVRISQGLVQCICTTAECHTQHVTSCTAQQMCYVQSMVNPLEGGDKTPMIIRGCIDERTPLLCENRQPETLDHEMSKAWPVLHCCKDDYCNRDVIPTPREPEVPDYVPEEYDYEDDDEDDDYNPEAGSENYEEHALLTNRNLTPYEPPNADKPKTINPLYIGVPVAGACVLLAIIIFAIYILKRQNRYMEDFYRNNLRQQGCVKPLNQGGKESGGICKDSCPYPDCERSSNGSETRLLMKV